MITMIALTTIVSGVDREKNAAQNKDEVTETAKAAAMFAATAALYSHSGLNAVPNSGGKNTNKSSTSEVSSGTTSRAAVKRQRQLCAWTTKAIKVKFSNARFGRLRSSRRLVFFGRRQGVGQGRVHAKRTRSSIFRR